MSTSLFQDSSKYKSVSDLNGFPLPADRLDYSLRRYFVDDFHTRYVPLLKAGSRVLDLGGNKVHKRGEFDINRYPFHVVYANYSVGKPPDVQSDAAYLPFKTGSFDAAICSELLEHVQDPLAVLREVHRVLRSQGILLICVPFLYHIHGDPFDYGRYTDHYWRENLGKIGFADIVIERQGLFWSVVMDMLRAWACELVKKGRPRSAWMQRLVTNAIAKGRRRVLAWEGTDGRVHDPFLSRYTTGFGIRVIKP